MEATALHLILALVLLCNGRATHASSVCFLVHFTFFISKQFAPIHAFEEHALHQIPASVTRVGEEAFAATVGLMISWSIFMATSRLSSWLRTRNLCRLSWRMHLRTRVSGISLRRKLVFHCSLFILSFSAICTPDCRGTCTIPYTCDCAIGFFGPTCEIRWCLDQPSPHHVSSRVLRDEVLWQQLGSGSSCS
jgi:hypothetical protein